MSIAQVANINVRKDLERSTSAYQKNLEQLSSGYKYTTLADNPVIVSEATKMQIGINFNTRLQSNIALGNDMLQIASSYQGNIIENVQRIKDLTLQAGNGSWTNSEKTELLNEIKNRLSYINSISTTANFNGTNLMDGSATNVYIKYGSNTSESIKLDPLLIDTRTTALNIDLAATTGSDLTQTVLDDYLNRLDVASTKLTSSCAEIDATTSRLDTLSENLTQKTQAMTDYKSSINDSDVAELSASTVQNQIMSQVSSTLFTQLGDIEKLKNSLFVSSSN